jgi:Peptidase family S41
MRRVHLAGLCLAVIAHGTARASPGPVDWSARLVEDAQAIHEGIALNTPGPVDRWQPGFNALSDAALALVRQRAARVHDEAGYVAALDAQIASYNDGHVELVLDLPPLPARWPGFLVGERGDGVWRVLTRAADAPVGTGAVLRACDGVPAAALAERNVAPFVGRWQLATARIFRGGRLLLDRGNPFIARPVDCVFDEAGLELSVHLHWRDLPASEIDRRLAETAPRAHPPIGSHVLADGTRWFNLSHFEADPGTPVGRALVALIAQMTRDRAAIRAAPAVVLDLRGNDGGSSDWSDQIAAAFDRSGASILTEWRVSPANQALLDADEKMLSSAPGASATDRALVASIAAGMKAAAGRGVSLWREPDTAPAAPEAVTEPTPRAVIYVLTDFLCQSACLDAVDRWRGLGAVQIGQQTGGDTYDLDARVDPLPSGAGTLYSPMKVYRNRPRGWNVPVTPTYLYPGDMRDTAALEAWVAALPR